MKTTFEDIKNQLITELPDILQQHEAYLVSTVTTRFSLYVVGASDEFLDQLRIKFGSLLDTIERIDADDFIHQHLQVGRTSVTETLFFVNRPVDKRNWFLTGERLTTIATTVAFYSFKGGLGRTTALVLSALQLARQGKRVALIDFDLEAPGLGSLFLTDRDSEDSVQVQGVVDYLIDLAANQYKADALDLASYYFTVNQQALVGQEGGELLVFPATSEQPIGGRQTTNYIDKLAKINLQFDKGQPYAPDILIQAIDHQLQPDFILIDTRTGVNDIGGIVFSRYADLSFLFFYGNAQNMFGMEAVLEKISLHNQPFYLVNSPVPREDESEEQQYFLETSYRIIAGLLYADDELMPDINDETAPHYPITVPYNDTAAFLNNTTKLRSLLQEGRVDNPYVRIANLMLAEVTPPAPVEKVPISKPALVQAISTIIDGTAASDEEFKTEADLLRKFYPRRDYRYIFDRNKFLILGEKGSGKTALYAVLAQPEYAKALANFCDTQAKESQRTQWIKGLDTTENFPTQLNFRTIKTLSDNQLRNYWLCLIVRQIPINLWPTEPEQVAGFQQLSLPEMRAWAENDERAEQLEVHLSALNRHLQQQGDYLTVVYDYLDRQLTDEDNLRGRLVGALLSLWYDYLNRFPNIRAKIFLRIDIYNREIPTGVTDKVKLNNFKQEIEWDYAQLLNMVWKRIMEQNEAAALPFLQNAGVAVPPKLDRLGYVPTFTDEQHRLLLDRLLGRRMGSNNKAFPYNWIIQHIADTKKHIQPRSMLNLFGLAAQRQLADPLTATEVIRPANMEGVMGEVSETRVRDLTEEYPDLAPVFEHLNRFIQQFPADDTPLRQALQELILDQKMDMKETPDTLIEKLSDIGVLYEYLFRRTNQEKRYHIPDLYLFGLGLRRLGPGASKAIFDKIGRNQRRR